MLAFEYKVNSYEVEEKEAIDCLKKYNYELAKEHIYNMMMEEDSFPKGHNLLGIMYELQGDLDLARKHYRASYALDQTYKAADKNLQRVTSFQYIFKLEDIDYGNKIYNEEYNLYKLVYDKRNIGRLLKR